MVPKKETVLFSSGLGGAAAYWAPQLDAFEQHFNVLTYNHRGTAGDRAPLPKGYSIADMADEVAALLDQHGIASCHFVGHALGGIIGIEFAHRHSSRLKRLAVINGWARMDLHTERCFEARLALLEHCGIRSYVRAQPIFLYPAAWASANADHLIAEDSLVEKHFQGAANLTARVAAMRAWDARGYLADIEGDVLALATQDDVLVPWTASERLAELLPHGQLALLKDGGHACNVTCPEATNAALLEFFEV
jgi:aminoacrylate hydrolase